MNKFLLTLLCLAPLLSACGVSTVDPAPQTLTVFAAASLTGVFDEIGRNFEAANPGVEVRFNFGGSHTLRAQIEHGARADVFASANAEEMEALVQGGFVGAGEAETFLANRLVVILPPGNPAGLENLSDLAGEGIRLVLAAREAPVGNYSVQALDRLDKTFGSGFKGRVLANVVSYENDVKQVVVKVQLGEADAGIVYASDAAAAPELPSIEIPAEANVVAAYPLAALDQAQSPALARDFIAYVLSAEGQSILQKWGFLPVK